MKSIPKKAKQEIARTNKILKKNKYSFKEYVSNVCYRKINVDIGDNIHLINGHEGIICGFNDNCNFNIYLFETKEISNIHPSMIKENIIRKK